MKTKTIEELDAEAAKLHQELMHAAAYGTGSEWLLALYRWQEAQAAAALAAAGGKEEATC